MRLEYEYDVQTAAAAVTQLELSSGKGPSRAAGSRDDGQPGLPNSPSSPSPLPPARWRAPASCCLHPAPCPQSSPPCLHPRCCSGQGPCRPHGTAEVADRAHLSRRRQRGSSPSVVTPERRPGLWVWLGLTSLMRCAGDSSHTRHDGEQRQGCRWEKSIRSEDGGCTLRHWPLPWWGGTGVPGLNTPAQESVPRGHFSSKQGQKPQERLRQGCHEPRPAKECHLALLTLGSLCMDITTLHLSSPEHHRARLKSFLWPSNLNTP